MQILLWRRQQEFRSSSGRWKPHIEIITFKKKIGIFSGIDVGLIGTKLWCVYNQQKLLPSLVFLQSDIVLCFQMFYLVKIFSYFGDPQNWQQYIRRAALTTYSNPVSAPGGYPPHPRELEPELQRGVRHLRPRRPQGQPRQVPAHRQHRPTHGQVSAATRSISSERVSWQRNFSSVSTTLY